MTHPSSSLDRRQFLAATAAALPLAATGVTAAPRSRPSRGPIAISSGNGLPAVTEAVARMRDGGSPTAAVVAGVSIVEADPDDMSVGLGGLPNADGVVQLDASVMDGPSHKAGAVAALEDILHPAQVALEVLRRTDHVLLVGAGAKAFARSLGHPEVNLLTERARQAWIRWRANGNPADDWLDDDQVVPIGTDPDQAAAPVPFTWGTIHCAGLDANGDLGACTTTSGLSWKIPGRVGDSPIVGAGMFVDNEVGAAGATGRGESVIQSCGAFQIVQRMERGVEPTQACLEALEWIAAHTKRPDLRNERGEPNFGCVFYALRKDGAYGSATFRGRREFAVHDGTEARRETCATLY